MRINFAIVCIVFLSSLVFSISICAASLVDEIDEAYLLAIRASMDSQGKDNYYISQIKTFDAEGGFGSKWEYIYVVANSKGHSIIIIYKVGESSVTQVWESIEIPGQVFDVWSYDLNNDWISEHQVITVKEYENGVKWYQLWIFSWEGSYSRLIYPKNIEDNQLTSLEKFINVDYDRDLTYEFIVLEKKDEENLYYKYYTFNKNNLDELMIEKEAIHPVNNNQNQPQIKELSYEEKYPEIVKFVQKKYGSIQIYGIHSIPSTFRYMVLSNIGKIVMEQRLAGVTELCKLDSSFDSYVFIPHMAMALDIDNDSMPEIPLYNFDEFDNKKRYFYFISVQPSKYKLLSPLDENGRSKIWTLDEPMRYDRAEDGNLVLVGLKYTKDGVSDSYWKWHPKAQQLIEVLDF